MRSEWFGCCQHLHRPISLRFCLFYQKGTVRESTKKFEWPEVSQNEIRECQRLNGSYGQSSRCWKRQMPGDEDGMKKMASSGVICFHSWQLQVKSVCEYWMLRLLPRQISKESNFERLWAYLLWRVQDSSGVIIVFCCNFLVAIVSRQVGFLDLTLELHLPKSRQ